MASGNPHRSSSSDKKTSDALAETNVPSNSNNLADTNVAHSAAGLVAETRRGTDSCRGHRAGRIFIGFQGKHRKRGRRGRSEKAQKSLASR